MHPAVVRGSVAAVGVVLLALAFAIFGGVLSYSVVPLAAAQTNTLSATLTTNGTGYTVGLQMHITALPKGSMVVNKIVATYGSTSETYYPYNASTGYEVTGYFTVTRYFTFNSAGAYSLDATFYATASGHDNGTAYTFTAPAISVTMPFPGGTSGCTSSCPSLTSSFTASVSGLSVSVQDVSHVGNATISSIGWVFGDGYSASGASVSHTFSAAGIYSITETVTATAGSQTLTSSSEVNVTVSHSASNGCAGSAGCGTAQSTAGITPTSGLLFGLGIGAIIAAGIWRWEGIVIAAGLAVAGFAVGMFVTGASFGGW